MENLEILVVKSNLEYLFGRSSGSNGGCPTIIRKGDSAIIIGKLLRDRKFSQCKNAKPTDVAIANPESAEVIFDEGIEVAVEIPWEMLELALISKIERL